MSAGKGKAPFATQPTRRTSALQYFPQVGAYATVHDISRQWKSLPWLRNDVAVKLLVSDAALLLID